uniref:Protein FAM50 homolog n=1 Tax=Caenorhabditis tropicalis TaxID=1561998 RepID=A0A1I7U8G5_9PELO
MSRADEGRLIHLAKKREREKEDIEKQLRKLEEDKEKCKVGITSKFTANYETMEESVKSKTYGLVSLDDMKNIQKNEISNRDLQVARGFASTSKQAKDSEEAREKEEHVAKHTQKRVLSFAYEDEEDDEDVAPIKPKKRVGMDPTVDTSFLPDKEREEFLRKKKEELAAEWRVKQNNEKNEEITVAYAYWDGSSHRKNMKIKKETLFPNVSQEQSRLSKRNLPN